MENTIFSHYLITRFNLRVDSWNTTREGETTLDLDWLVDRFHLFETYCLPSVLNQSNKNFHWIIYFDNSTPESFFPKIEKIANSWENIKCIFIDGIKELNDSFTKLILDDINDEINWVISSRMDNDDMIHQDFINTIQDNFIPKHNTVIDLRKGLQLNLLTKKIEVRQLHNSFNPFISLIENRNDIRTVISKLHRDWYKADHIKINNENNLWIEVVHKKNKLNSVSIDHKLIYFRDFNEFGLQMLHYKISSRFFNYYYNIQYTLNTKLRYYSGLLKFKMNKVFYSQRKKS